MRNLPKIFLRSLENVASSAWEESRTSTDERRYPTVRSTKEPSNLSSQKQLSRVDSSSWSHLSRGSTTRSLPGATTLWLEEKTRPSSPDLAMTWWCGCLNLPANLICTQHTRVLTTRRKYARRLVPDRFRLPPRTPGTNYLQTFTRSPLFRL